MEPELAEVLREAARCWCRLDQQGWGVLRMGVNISALQFQEGLVDDVGVVIAEFDLLGTNTGEFVGLEPTGRSFRVRSRGEPWYGRPVPTVKRKVHV